MASLRQRKGVIGWAATALFSAPGKAWDGVATRLEPTVGLLSEGYEPGQAPNARVFNWLFGFFAESLNRLRNVDTAGWIKSGDTTPTSLVSWVGAAYCDDATNGSTVLIVSADDEARASLDGQNWISVTGALAGTSRAAAYVGGAIDRWFVVGASSIRKRVRDLNASDWASMANPVASDWNGIASSTTATEKIVICGSAGKIASSADGTTFTNRSPAGSDDFNAACWSDDLDLYVVVGDAGRIFTSPDGITWTARTSGTTADLIFVTYDARTGVFVAVASNGVTRRSADGVTWTGGTTMSGDPIVACAHDGEGTIVALQDANAGGWASTVARRSRVRASVDGGASWEIVGKVDQNFIPRALVWAVDLGWLAAGGDNLTEGVVYRSGKL